MRESLTNTLKKVTVIVDPEALDSTPKYRRTNSTGKFKMGFSTRTSEAFRCDS